MSVPTALPARPTRPSSGHTFAAGSLGDVQHAIDACVSGRGDIVDLPSQTLAVSARFLDKNDVMLRLQPSTKITGNNDVGVYIFRADGIWVSGKGEITVPGADGIGCYSGSQHYFTGGLKVHDCQGQGILLNQSGVGQPMDNIWIEGVEAYNNGRSGAFTNEPGYWKFGCHSFYIGGGRDSFVRAVLYGNYVHDQICGYGTQLGGEAQNCIVAYSLYERCNGQAAGGVVSDRNARGVQIYSSYSNSKDNLITSNLFRDCPGAWAGTGPPAGIQGEARYNVYWNSGQIALNYGSEQGLRDAGHNTQRDIHTLADAKAAGLLEAAFSGGVAPDPDPDPDPNPPPAPSIHQTILDGSKIKGTVLWTADTTDDSQVGTVDFIVDGAVVHTEADPPYGNGEAPNTDAGQYDTTKHLTDGAHVLSARANLKPGGSARVDAHVTVENGVPVSGLHKLSETATTITLGWDPVPNAYGYRFLADGHPVSVTFDSTRTSVKFAKGAGEYGVLALVKGVELTYP